MSLTTYVFDFLIHGRIVHLSYGQKSPLAIEGTIAIEILRRFLMSTDNADQPVQSGDTFIAYIDDSASCVGVVIGDGNDEMDFKTLVLGYFKEISNSTRRDVFEEPFPYTFPGYLEIAKRRVVPYDFELEIALCKARNSAWWKSLQAPCYTNLVGKHFRPSKIQELQYIDMAKHIL